MKVITWNVNNRLGVVSQQVQVLGQHEPDVVALQDVNGNAVSRYIDAFRMIGLPYVLHTRERQHKAVPTGVLLASRFPLSLLQMCLRVSSGVKGTSHPIARNCGSIGQGARSSRCWTVPGETSKWRTFISLQPIISKGMPMEVESSIRISSWICVPASTRLSLLLPIGL